MRDDDEETPVKRGPHRKKAISESSESSEEEAPVIRKVVLQDLPAKKTLSSQFNRAVLGSERAGPSSSHRIELKRLSPILSRNRVDPMKEKGKGKEREQEEEEEEEEEEQEEEEQEEEVKKRMENYYR